MRTRGCDARAPSLPRVLPPPPARIALRFRELLLGAARPGHAPAPGKTPAFVRLDNHQPTTFPPPAPSSRDPEARTTDDQDRGESGQHGADWHESPELDPLMRCLASDAPLRSPPSAEPLEATARLDAVRAAVIEPLLQSLVRRAAWGRSADGRSTTLQLEIGDGPLAGATVMITADSRDLNIELDAPPDIDLEAWKTRLRHRLASQGLTATIS